jgi:hypothetical protein
MYNLHTRKRKGKKMMDERGQLFNSHSVFWNLSKDLKGYNLLDNSILKNNCLNSRVTNYTHQII